MSDSSNAVMEKLLLQKPQVNLARSSVARMWLVSLCAFMAVMQSSFSDSFSSLAVALAAVSGATLSEIFMLSKIGKASHIRDGSAVATALILTLFLPNRIHPVYAALGAFFAIAVVKHSFGGLGANWLNPAAGGWLFIRCTWPSSFNGPLEASPLSILEKSVSLGAVNAGSSPFDIISAGSYLFREGESGAGSAVRSFLNSLFSMTGTEIPGGYIDLFNAAPAGIIADRGILALLAGTIIITASQVSRSWIPVLWLGIYAFLVRMAGALHYGGALWQGDLLFAFFSGGVIPAAFILCADPATGAKSNFGIAFAAAAGSVLSWLFRYGGGEPYGVVFAAAVINAFLPLIRNFERRLFYEKKGGSVQTEDPSGKMAVNGMSSVEQSAGVLNDR